MVRFSLKALTLVVFFGASLNASANDAVAALGAGGIVIGKTDEITMEKEDLFISENNIRVSYLFRNTSSHDITTRIAFPVPEFPKEPEMDIGLDVNSNNPMDFSVRVDGKKVPFDTEVKKRDDKIKVTHHWMQTFPAGETLVVSHTYKPATGGEAQMWFREDDREGKIRRYCIEPDFAGWIDRKVAEGSGVILSPNFVDYILTTGANWKGPIGRFRLTIQKEKPEDKISFCGTGVKKTDPRTFVMEKTDFTPQHDLHVMFIHENHYE